MPPKKKGKENDDDTALAVPGKKKLEAEVVLYSGSKEISAQLEKAQTLSKHDFYKVGNKDVPSARALQWLANRKQIKTQIVDIQSDKDYCRAVVGGWIGDNPDPKANAIYKEATVEVIFELELADKMLDLVTKYNLTKGDDWTVGEDGLPCMTNPRFQTKVMKELIRMRKFALRTVVTKAERIIHSKLADTEWREQDELDDEKSEVESVSGRRVTQPKEEKPTQKAPGKKVEKQEEEPEEQDFIDADHTEVPDEPDEESRIDKFLSKLKEDKTVTRKMTPREALIAIDDASFPGYSDEFKELLIQFCDNFLDDNLERFQIPESACKALVKKATGISLKLSEETPECKKGKCKNKITEPEAEEHDDLCNEHWQEQNN